ncbi:molecular chaperone HscC [Escherichia coli]
MDNAELAIGIDLGTTNSLIAVWKDGAAQLIPNKFGEYLTPSIISMDENNHILVGKPAVSRRTSHPDKTAALFKRAMGSNTNWRLGSDTFNAPELSSLVLRSLKEDAEEFLQRPIKDVVISVPAYFSDEQRKHTRLAAELAGLNAVRLINEPTAAAMAYGLHTQQNTRSLVFDLGGGTFDVTVLEYATPVIEVHASAGDNFLGGEDFTHMLVDDVLKRADVARTTLNESELAALYACVEAAKCSNQSPLHIRWQYQDETRECEFYENELEDLWLPLLNRLRVPIEQALRDARLKPSQIDSLVLVGGASQMPLVQRIAVRLFGKLPYQSYDPSTIVALGAAIQAACRLRSEDIEEVILTDICPYSLGVEVNRQGISGIFSPIIERNTTVPVSRVETYSTMHPEQDSITVNVYQGENHKVKNNILVESFDVPLKKTGAYQSIDIRFSYDINGLLEVDVLLEDGSVKSRVINHSPVTLSAQQIEESRTRLSALKIYPRDMLINRTFKAKQEELWARALGDEREEIGRVITDFDAALQSNDMARVDEVRRRASVYLAIETS